MVGERGCSYADHQTTPFWKKFEYEYAGYSRYFEGLQIWKSEKYRELQGSYPVIFISFASVKGASYQDARMGIIQILLDLYKTIESFTKAVERFSNMG